ncbi:MAG: gephyrin-like molybdotransferase Glp [Hydrogenobacter sp.]|uniref:molybdopterin molybdotransferase MoeA n=1 Tax=Hydrogenobacter thermophilus TaxID=940 RepID=UPI0030F51081
MSLLAYEEALSIILEHTKLIDAERVFLSQAIGRVLAEDILADTDKPPFDNSAMDGYAVRYEDIKEASEERPVRLRIAGELSAGDEKDFKVEKGSAVIIFTGAPLPDGADCVIPFELTQREGDYVLIKRALKIGSNIRRKGEEVKEGQILLQTGTLIRPYEVGIMASVNKALVFVYRKPKVAILATGDEIKDVGETINKPSQIRSSNSYTLLSQVIRDGGEAHYLGIVKDNEEEISSALRSIHNYDVFITTGGVSMGGKDYIQYLVKDCGIDVKFHKVRIKPAKPVLFGTYGEKGLFFGLPGNPVSCSMAFDLLVRPAILKMSGRHRYIPDVFKATLKESFHRKDAERREFVRAYVWFEGERAYCSYSHKTQSHMLTSYVNMNAYMVVYEGVYEINKDSLVDVIMFP